MDNNVVGKDELKKSFVEICSELENNISYLEQELDGDEKLLKVIRDMKYQMKVAKAFGS